MNTNSTTPRPKKKAAPKKTKGKPATGDAEARSAALEAAVEDLKYWLKYWRAFRKRGATP